MKKSEYDFKILPDEAYKDDLSYAEKEQADGMLTTAVFGPETEQAKRDEERRSAAGLCFEWLQALAGNCGFASYLCIQVGRCRRRINDGHAAS